MKIKKLISYFNIVIFTGGASLTLGLLSFGGTIVILPLLPFILPVLTTSFIFFGLSVFYEGTIYFDNIQKAFSKLFLKRNYLERFMANDYLKTLFTLPPTLEHIDERPQFFKDYENQLRVFSALNISNLDKAQKPLRDQIEKDLHEMEKCFARCLYSPKEDGDETLTNYEKELQQWLATDRKAQQKKLAERRFIFHAAKIFSVIAALFMGFGNIYLLVEAFAAIPLLAAIPFSFLPFCIIPLAAIAGAAWGFLVYNALTDMVNDNTLGKWFSKFQECFSKGFSLQNIVLVLSATALFSLALLLTICTAGTWWTIVKHTRPLFGWMTKIPVIFMGVIHPLVTGLSALVFIVQNTSASLEQVEKFINFLFNNIIGSCENGLNSLGKSWTKLRQRENPLQIINPVRIFIKLTLTPLLIILFLGHLVSIALTANRMPGINQILSSLFALISEGFEDADYFNFINLGHHHHKHHHKHGAEVSISDLVEERFGSHHGHNHNADLPTLTLKFLFIPAYILATAWDCLASKLNDPTAKSGNKKPTVHTWGQAWRQQRGEKESKTIAFSTNPTLSPEWKGTKRIYKLERFEEKHLNHAHINKKLAEEKKKDLRKLQKATATAVNTKEELPDFKKLADTTELYNKRRYHYFKSNAPTSTNKTLYKIADSSDYSEAISAGINATAA